MKPFARFVLLIVVATVLVGCVANIVEPPPVNHAPASTTDNSAPSAFNVARNAPTPLTPAAVIASLSIAVSGDNTPAVVAPPRDPSDSDQQRVQDLRATQKTSPSSSSASTTPNATVLVSKPGHPLEGAELYVHVPPQANSQQPLRVLVALHGMGGRGDVFSQSLLKEAERNDWVLIAPTFQYHDYLDPKQLMEDDIQFTRRIQDTLDVLPQRLNLKLRQHILIYGFSRGAQLAHRFAYFYPERVESVVTLSAGAYTLPAEKRSTDKGIQLIQFPYGIGDLQECIGKPVNWQALKKISFWIGVGAQDDQASDVSRAFDQYGGKTRIKRAQSFQQALKAIGIDVHLVIFPRAAHEITPEMSENGVQFLHDDEVADHWDD